jgi:hypothetical protein
LAAGEDQAEDLLDRLILEVKGVSLLYPSEAELQEKLEGRMARSNDESIRRFVKALQIRGQGQTGRLLVIAMGDLLLASFLVIAGAVILVPTVVGVNTLQGIVQFFAERTSGSTTGSLLTPYLSFVEFAVGAILVISSFYSLREAAANLKQAGIAIKSGEA